MFSNPAASTSFPGWTTPSTLTSLGISGQGGSGFQFSQPTTTTPPCTFTLGVNGTNSFGSTTTTPVACPTFNFSPSSQNLQPPFTFGPNYGVTNNNLNSVASANTSNIYPLSLAFSPTTTNISSNTPAKILMENNSTQVQGTGKLVEETDISNSFTFGTLSTPFNTITNSTWPLKGQPNKDIIVPKASCKNIVHEVYSDEKLIGFTIVSSRIQDFLSQIKNLSNCHYEVSGTIDKDMLDVVSCISRYCWENDQSLTPTSQCGLFLFKSIHDEPKLSLIECEKFQKSYSKFYSSINQNYSKEIFKEADELLKRSRQPLSEQKETQYIFKPKILKFLNSCNNLCQNSISPFYSKYNRTIVGTTSSNLLKETFPPTRPQISKWESKNSKVPVGNLPFRLDGLLKPRPNSKRTLPPLNYDDYLKKYHEEKNEIMMESLYWKKSCPIANTKSVDILMKPKIQKSKSVEQVHINKIKSKLVNQRLSRFRTDKSKNPIDNDAQPSDSSSSDLDTVEPMTIKNKMQSVTINSDVMSNTMTDDQDNILVNSDDLNQSTVTNFTKCYSAASKAQRQHSFELQDFSILRRRSKFLSTQPKARICRINLTRKFYYCKPSLHTLDSLVDSLGHCFVNEFIVGHENFGHVTFHGAMDVMGLNLDEIVSFKLKELNLYPDEYEDQLVLQGQGLKRPATVTLFNVWPMDKERTHFITDRNYIDSKNYQGTLRRSCQRMGATFVSYSSDLGHWTFRINESTSSYKT